ncbi:MAG: hypothetical protein KKB77_07160 [Bacteroidetes bacterium]|nr:hypothetical protein [Bacteroidota bacterium]
MTQNKFIYFPILIFINLLVVAHTFAFLLDDKKYYKDIPITTERELKINIESALGKLTIGRVESNNALELEVVRDSKLGDPTEKIDYKVRDGIGYLKLPGYSKESKGKSVKLSGFDGENWRIYFTDKVPISFDIELGAGKGYFDFTGLRVKDLNISTGASSVTVKFDEMNKNTIENLHIESGVSKFKAYNLLNANFNSFSFSGGVGSYELDFGGELNKEVDVNIEIGLGSLSVLIPKYIEAKVTYEKNWISNIDLDRSFSEESENEYVTSNYYNTRGKMNIKIEAGIGSVRLKRVK